MVIWGGHLPGLPGVGVEAPDAEDELLVGDIACLVDRVDHRAGQRGSGVDGQVPGGAGAGAGPGA